MHVVIVGAAGMIGRKLTAWLCHEPSIGDATVSRLTLVDVAPLDMPAAPGLAVETVIADVADPAAAAALVASCPAVVFHVAATVMGQAEASVAAGYRINLDTVRSLLEASARIRGYCPRFVYASSTAVFGPPLPPVIPEDFVQHPQSSYGTQKAMSELLISDYVRLGHVDAVGLRLPTICVRPGQPTGGNSGFFSNIIREPLAGREAVLPVGEEVRHWFATPRAAVGYLVHAAAMDTAPLGGQRHLTMPGLSATVGEALAALGRFGGPGALDLVRREPDPAMIAMAAGLPQSLDVSRARAFGFRADGLGLGPEETFDDIVRIYCEDDVNPTPTLSREAR